MHLGTGGIRIKSWTFRPRFWWRKSLQTWRTSATRHIENRHSFTTSSRMLRHVASGTTSPLGVSVPGRWSIRWVSCFALSLQIATDFQIEGIPQTAFLRRNSNMEAENEDSFIFSFNVVPLSCIYSSVSTGFGLKQTIPASAHPDLPCFRSACSRLTVQVYKCSSGKYMVDVLVPQAHLNQQLRLSFVNANWWQGPSLPAVQAALQFIRRLSEREASPFSRVHLVCDIYIYTHMYGLDFIDRIWMTWSSVSGCEWQHREQARQDNVQRTLYLYTFQTSLILMPSDVCPRTAARHGAMTEPQSQSSISCV